MRGLWNFVLFFTVLLGTVQCQDEDVAPLDDASPEDHHDEEAAPEHDGEGDHAPGDGPMSTDQLYSFFAKMDGNKDNKVSVEELLGFSHSIAKISARHNAHQSLDDIDADKDGKVSLQELHGDFTMWDSMDDKARAEEEKALEKAKFKAADEDGDGFLDKEELAVIMQPELHPEVLKMTTEALMKSKDKDGNKELSSKEFWAPENPASVEGEEQPQPEEDEMLKADFAKLDKDKSGSISMQELTAWVSGHFYVEKAMDELISNADKDGDKHLTFAELDQAKEAIANTDAHFHLMDFHTHHAEL